MYRSHTCGELRDDHIGQEVTLSGWVNKRRDLGGVIFIDLRDRYGITQLVIEPDQATAMEVGQELRAEFIVKITGQVAKRSEEAVNKDLETGMIEIKVSQAEILSRAETPPFEIADETLEVNEELRLKYRFLDIRRKKLQDTLMFRAKVIRHIHNYMDDHGYIEIATPLLTASSPEGARDFLVPSRIHPGKFYALPQAPQQFKQLLMVGGMDKYYQIAPCFRDEDPRADRSPGEFYQLDVECSFKTSEEFFQEMEPLLVELTEQVAGKQVLQKPFPRIPYKEALDKYGSDRPDLRYGLEFHDITEMANKSEFAVFNKARVVKGLKVDRAAEGFSRKVIDTEFIPVAESKDAKGLVWLKVTDAGIEGSSAKFFSDEEKKYFIKEFEAKNGDVLFFVADEYKIVIEALAAVRELAAVKLELADPNVVGWAWIIDFPMYERDEQTGKIDFMHNPFSMPIGGLEALNTQDPLEVKADQYDIIANGLELSSGAVRNSDPDIMYKAFEIAGYTKEQVNDKFGHMIDAFKYGAPPHCGFAPGIERLVMVLRNETSIREVIAFPKNSRAQDVMMDAPAEVSPEQLRELNLKIVK